MPLGRPQDVSEGRPQGVGWTTPLEVNIRRYEDVLKTSTGEVFKTLVGASHCVTYRTVWGCLQDGTLGRPQDVIFQCPMTLVGDVAWRYIENHMETSRGRLIGTSSGHPWGVILLSGISPEKKVEYIVSLGTYNTNSPIRFKTLMLKSRLCDYSHVYIFVKRILTVRNTAAAGAAENHANKKGYI